MSRDTAGKLELRKEKGRSRPEKEGRGSTKGYQKESGDDASKRDANQHCKGGKHLSRCGRMNWMLGQPCKRYTHWQC